MASLARPKALLMYPVIVYTEPLTENYSYEILKKKGYF